MIDTARKQKIRKYDSGTMPLLSIKHASLISHFVELKFSRNTSL